MHFLKKMTTEWLNYHQINFKNPQSMSIMSQKSYHLHKYASTQLL